MKSKLKDPWLAISDMMTGLMMVFLFITVSYAHNVKKESETAVEEAVASHDNIEEIISEIIDARAKIAEDLHREFDKDLERWDATIDDETLTFRFNSPEVLFRAGDANVSSLFNEIISDFWPRYLSILNSNSNQIYEIKIEGHTSSEWSSRVTRNESYFNNMKLSQDRSRNVLEKCFDYTPPELIEWSIATITANGFSFSRLKYSENGEEDPETSRRVEFTIHVHTSESIDEIAETL
jgi:outer membrane protein OmpA-like peptidoglycan-associated protein